MDKNIWYISKYARPVKYGFGSRHFFLSREFNKKGHHATVIASDSTHNGMYPEFEKRYNYEIIDGVDSYFVKTKKYERASSFGRIISWIDFERKLLSWDKSILHRPDVIIVSSLSIFTILTGYLFKKRFNAKLIFEVRDIWPKTIIEVGGYSSRNPFVKMIGWVEKFGYKKSDAIVGTMPNLGEHVAEKIGKKKKTYCIPQGLDVSFYKKTEPLPREFSEKYIPPNKFIIGYAGSIGASNALETLVTCAHELEKEDIHFLLVGDGEKRSQFIRETKNLTNITFCPKIRRQQVQSFLSHCNVVYDSVKDISLTKYGQSRNKWIDYMFAAKPMIVSYDGYKSMINEAGNGFFVKPEDVSELKNKILELYDLGTIERKEMGQKGKEWLLKNRTFSKLADNYLEIMENC